MPPEPLPVWTILDQSSLEALTQTPRAGLPPAVVLNRQEVAAISASVPILVTARQMLVRAQEAGGFALTATGALTRSETRFLFDRLEWPDFDKDEVLRLSKVINEADVMPLQLLRIALKEAKLLRAREGRLLATRKSNELLEPSASADLFALLFETVLWRLNLGYFDRILIEQWPQDQMGLALWSLSMTANDWSDPDELLEVCLSITSRSGTQVICLNLATTGGNFTLRASLRARPVLAEIDGNVSTGLS